MVIIPTMLYPVNEIIEWNTNYLFFHTVFFHNWVIFMFLLILALNLHECKKKHYLKEIFIFGIGYSIIAASFSYLLKTNFSNFYECNMGPIKALVDSIAASSGATLATLVYVVVLTFLHAGFFIASYYVYRLVANLFKKIQSSVKKN